MNIRVSHVGSFPFDQTHEYIKRSLEGYISAGVDVPAYPQLRNFVRMFLEPYIREGTLVETGGMYLIKDYEGLKKSSVSRAILWEAEEFSHLAGNSFKYMRGPVTGAFTLASNILLSPRAQDLSATALADRGLLESLIEYTKQNLKYLESIGYNVLFVDEPMLSVIVGTRKLLLGYTPDDVVNYINYVYEGVKVERCIHVCGRVSRLLFQTLLRVDKLDVVNLEFYDIRENIGLLSRELLESHSKRLAPGVASSKTLHVEPLSEILDLLKEIIKRAGPNVDLVSADDGFGGLRNAAPVDKLYEISFGKLKRIKEAVTKLLSELPDKL